MPRRHLSVLSLHRLRTGALKGPATYAWRSTRGLPGPGYAVRTALPAFPQRQQAAVAPGADCGWGNRPLYAASTSSPRRGRRTVGRAPGARPPSAWGKASPLPIPLSQSSGGPQASLLHCGFSVPGALLRSSPLRSPVSPPKGSGRESLRLLSCKAWHLSLGGPGKPGPVLVRRQSVLSSRP